MKLSVSLLSGVLLLSMLSLTNNSDAQALSGKVCKKAGLKKIEGSKLFTCTKSGQRFVWNKGIELEEADIVFVSTKMTFGSGVKYYFTATKGDECLVSLYVNSQLQDSQTYSITSASKVESSFWSDPVSNSWIQLDCKFSGSDSEFIPNDFVVKPSPTPRVTVSPTPTPRVTVSPSPTPRVTATASASPTNPFAGAADAAAKEAAEKKRIDDERARLAEEEKELQRQKTISLALSRLLESYCGKRLNCDVGKTGPGGGLIFYHSQQPQWWGTYLEVRPTFAKSDWCDKPTLELTKNVTDLKLLPLVGQELGKGKANTQLMLAACSSGAANLASAFRGGGLDDWYLPSYKELDQICKFAAGSYLGEESICHRAENQWNLWNYFPSIGQYWSSSEFTDSITPEGGFAWFIQFYDGKKGPLSKRAVRDVLAIRAFGPKS
jgi:hypothetical protein